MDASQYKDYILTLLFVKYVSDKFTGEDYADIDVPEGGSFDDMVKLIGKKDIGEGIDTIIGKLAESNNLHGIIDKVSFNDSDKLGKGDEMVKKLPPFMTPPAVPERCLSGRSTKRPFPIIRYRVQNSIITMAKYIIFIMAIF